MYCSSQRTDRCIYGLDWWVWTGQQAQKLTKSWGQSADGAPRHRVPKRQEKKQKKSSVHEEDEKSLNENQNFSFPMTIILTGGGVGRDSSMATCVYTLGVQFPFGTASLDCRNVTWMWNCLPTQFIRTSPMSTAGMLPKGNYWCRMLISFRTWDVCLTGVAQNWRMIEYILEPCLVYIVSPRNTFSVYEVPLSLTQLLVSPR